jgi:hypothetical protein
MAMPRRPGRAARPPRARSACELRFVRGQVETRAVTREWTVHVEFCFIGESHSTIFEDILNENLHAWARAKIDSFCMSFVIQAYYQA